MLTAEWILGTLAAVFAVLAVARLVRQRGRWDTMSRTWTLIAVIFVIVVAVFSR